jgi:hypothetical protein
MGVCLLWVLCCQVKVFAMSSSVVHRGPTDCGASLCVMLKPRELGGPGPGGGDVAPKEKNRFIFINLVKVRFSGTVKVSVRSVERVENCM